MTGQRPWRVPVVVAQIPERGLQLELVADAATRERLAVVAKLRAMPAAAAQVTLTPVGDGKIRVSGRVQATVGQTCVVTLEPVEATVDETFEVLFLPEGATMPVHTEGDDDDAPEPIVKGMIDVGSLATDYLFLGIDPYPRRPGVVFKPAEQPADAEDHPFAALEALRGGARPVEASDGEVQPEPPAGHRGRPPRKGR